VASTALTAAQRHRQCALRTPTPPLPQCGREDDGATRSTQPQPQLRLRLRLHLLRLRWQQYVQRHLAARSASCHLLLLTPHPRHRVQSSPPRRKQARRRTGISALRAVAEVVELELEQPRISRDLKLKAFVWETRRRRKARRRSGGRRHDRIHGGSGSAQRDLSCAAQRHMKRVK